jgi:hypothetical protein
MGTATICLAEWARGYLCSNKEMEVAKDSFLEQQMKQVPITLRNGRMTYNAILDVSTVFLWPLLLRLIVVV